MTQLTTTQLKARALLEAIKAKRQAKEAMPVSAEEQAEKEASEAEPQSSIPVSNIPSIHNNSSKEEAKEQEKEKEEQEQEEQKAFQWNEAQRRFISLGSDIHSLENRRILLTGPAGTGKTTAMKGLVSMFQIQAKLGGFPTLQSSSKHLSYGSLGVVAVSFTNKAVANIKKVLPKELKSHAMTIHKLIEFEPVFYEVWDEVQKKMRKTMRFEPQRNKQRLLPAGLAVVIIDEASMVATAERDGTGAATALFEQLEDALQPGTKIIFSGDIQQLPPVFGDSILGHSLLKIPTVELTEVYRQALESPIILNAHRILKGQWGYFNSRAEPDPKNSKRTVVPAFQKIMEEAKGKITIAHWQKKLAPEHAVKAIAGAFAAKVEDGSYSPDEDILLCPFNVGFGTVEINKSIAQFLGLRREAIVHEVIAGFNKHYYAVGDKVMWMKEEFRIIEINPNAGYFGVTPQQPNKMLDRWGCLQKAGLSTKEIIEAEEKNIAFHGDLDKLLDKMANDKDADRFNQASHVITLENMADPSVKETIATAGEVNALDFGYCITVHKSQGSEWSRVFLLFHHTHAVMLFRELLYTAFTRAKEEVHIICEANSLEKCVKNPRIKGDTIEAKAAWFTARKESKKKLKELELDLNLN